jgi:hypothetical protein
MWSGANDVVSSVRDDPRYYNYWEAWVPGSWLYNGLWDPKQPASLPQQANVLTYFQRMSTAYARRCGGTIRAMSLFPENLAKYPYIFRDQELRTLRNRLSAGGLFAPTNFIAIDAVDPTKQYNIDWATLAATPRPQALIEAEFNATQGLRRRDNCLTNTDYEPVGTDWFG